jgi:RIO kinase 1
MKIPKLIKPLIEEGLISEVIQSIMSGKEASLYVVRCGTKIRCAKVYKELNKRGFKKSAQYQEGRKIKNSRRARAIQKGSRYGKQQQEETWQNAELLALRRVGECGVRVPETFGYFDGILLMELITNEQGHVASRLADISMSKETALFEYNIVIRYIVYMLCAGIIHGDLSEFNVLVGADGLVIIDLPQAVDAPSNNNAESMLKRDVNNITQYFSNFAPELGNTRYGDEIWSLYVEGNLRPDIALTGIYDEPNKATDIDTVMLEIKATIAEEEARLARAKESE